MTTDHAKAVMPTWPKEEPDAATLTRYFVARGQFCLGLMTGCEPGAFEEGEGSPLLLRYMSALHQMQHACDVVMLLESVVDADREAARIWLMAEAGDCYGEALWDWVTAGGLDPEAIHAAGVEAAKAAQR